jgi:3D (Asp-Asp-Asp) domain-containing protein
VKFMPTEQFEVVAVDGLNLRSDPSIGLDNVIATLPQGHQVSKLEESFDERWWKVSTVFGGNNLKGFVAKRFLASVTVFTNESFDFAEPTDSDLGSSLSLWATFYNVHTARSTMGGNPLLNPAGNSLGASLSDKDWCNAAVEGTVRVLDASNNVIGTFNFAGEGSTEQVNCSRFFPSLAPNVIRGTNRARFNLSTGPFGVGTNGFILIPFRTIAVDRTFIPMGSVIYIPEARGKTFVLPSGKSVTHDGYFFAADVGGAIKDNHIDVFLGILTESPFPFVQSRKDRPFSAFLIDSNQIVKALELMHKV